MVTNIGASGLLISFHNQQGVNSPYPDYLTSPTEY
jgi:hypothetical protein